MTLTRAEVNETGIWRANVAKAVLVAFLLIHAALLIRGGTDPHKLFGFRPFNESDTWQADIVRVTADGSRRPIDDGTWTYDWNELVANPEMMSPGRAQHASGGADAVVDFLDRSLAWTLEHIPDDRETVALEATVTIHRNTRGPEVVVLRRDRERGS